MKNHQYIREKMKVKELAKLLLQERTVTDYDEGLDGEWHECGFYEEYLLPNGTVCGNDYDTALLNMMNWLNADRPE